MAEHECFPLKADGVTAHVHGDPGMSPEAREALGDLIRAAAQVTDERDAAMTPEERARVAAVRARNRARMERLRRP